MKNNILKGLAGIIAAIAVALVFIPMSAQAAGEPQVSLTSTWCEFNGATFVVVRNNGSLGAQVNNYNWTISEKAVDVDTGIVELQYNESRKVITDPIYVDTSKFRVNAYTYVSITATCPELGYSYTTNFTIKNDKNVKGGLTVIQPSSAVLYNGQSNNTLDAYLSNLGDLAKASVKAFCPVGYMPACEGAISFNYKLDYLNKSGIICLQIPEGLQATNRTFKLMTIGEGGLITVCDDLDVNPSTITSQINFNGFAIALVYSETGAAPVAVGAPSSLPNAQGSVTGVTPAYQVLANAKFVEAPQGNQCMNTFAAFTPLGYRGIKTYNLVLNGAVNYNAKNGVVTLNVPAGYTDYKLITVDANGAVQIADDMDALPGTATFVVNFNGYAVQLVGR
jgi:hypothetical protein